MLSKIHRPRDPTGFVKYAYTNVSINWQQKAVPWLVKLPNVTLTKAADIDEWKEKLVSNRIKIVAVTYSVVVEPTVQNISGQMPTEGPVRIDVVRFNQTSPAEVTTRYSGSHTNKNWYLLDHNVPLPTNAGATISVCSPPNIPLDRATLLNPKIFDANSAVLDQHMPIQYNSNNIATTFRMSQTNLTKYVLVDCVVDIPDDGNPATTISLEQCIGEIPEVFFIAYWNLRFASNPFPITANYYVTGTVGIVYQDIGTKLSHL